jgi:hypothetical protein
MKVTALILIFFSCSPAAFSQTADTSLQKKRIVPWFVERFKISAGFFYVVNKTNIQVGVNGMSGTDVDLERDFGFSKEIGTFFANGQWRISSRSRLNLNYYYIGRSSNHTLNKDFVFEDNVYPVNSSVHTFFNTAIYQFSYGYAFISKAKFELGFLIGAHILGSKVGITLNGTNTGINQSNDFGFTAPIPDLGIWGGYAFSDRFAINFDMDYLGLTIGNFTNRVLSSNLNFTYRLVKKLDLSLGYAGLNFKVNATKENAEGRFKWGYNGPALGLNFSFGKRTWDHLK